jgi:Predicted membrane protein
MNKQEFMRQLAEGLTKLPRAEVSDILADMEEYFTCAAAEGGSEQELCARLGDPKKLAKEFSVQRYIETAQQERSAKNMAKAVFSTAGLGIIDFLYVMFVVVTGYIVIASFYIAVCAVGLSAIGVLAVSIIYFGMVSILAGWFGVLVSIVLLGLSVLGFVGLMQLGKRFKKANMMFLNHISERIKGGKDNE